MIKKYLWTLSLTLLSSCYPLREPAEPMNLPIQPLEEAITAVENNPIFTIGETIPSRWWEIFKDNQLSRLIAIALNFNPSINEAYAQIELACYQADNARSTLFPNISFSGYVTRNHITKTGALPPTPPGAPFFLPFDYTLYDLQFNLLYDFDLWYKNRNTLYAAIDNTYAQMAEDALVRLAVSISVAQAYYNIQIDYARLDNVNALIGNREQYFKLVKQRKLHNLASDLDLLPIENILSAAKRLKIGIENDLAINQHQLDALLAEDITHSLEKVPVDEECLPSIPLPSNIPLHLIGNRPDIQAKLWMIEAAGATTEAAKAGFYPDVNLSALAGFQTITLSKLFNYDSTNCIGGPAFNLPLFTGGQLESALGISEVNYDLAIYQYNGLVLQAVQQVLDGIDMLKNSHEAVGLYNKEISNQIRLIKLTKMRVKSNLNSDLDTLNQEQILMNDREAALLEKRAEITAFLSLIKALGGGYSTIDYFQCE